MQWPDLLLIGGLAAIVLAAVLLRTAIGKARRGGLPFERRWPSSARPWATREPRFGPGEDRSTSTVVPFRPTMAEVGLPGQLEIVERSSYRTRTIMSKAEFRVFRIVESEIRSLRLKHRAFAQVSLGEILACDDPDGFRWINSKRADIVVVDAFGNPVVAVEFQGQGHDQGNAPTRDAVKRTALRRAGVAYLEILADHSDDDIRSLLRVAFRSGPGQPPMPNSGSRAPVASGGPTSASSSARSDG